MSPEQHVHELFQKHIPLTRAMNVRVESFRAGELILSAPIEPNHNHLGTAFGGSLHALATLSAYGWLWLEMGVSQGINADFHVVVRESQMQYLAPVRSELRAVCGRPPEESIAKFWKDFKARGKARLNVDAVIEDEFKKVAARFRGEFVALAD